MIITLRFGVFLRLALWPSVWSILVTVQSALKNNMPRAGVDCVVLLMSNRSSLLVVFSKPVIFC